MRKIALLFLALAFTQAHAGKITCANVAKDPLKGENRELEVVETLEIVGVLDTMGLLDVRKDQETMATITSKAHGPNACQGVELDSNQPVQSKNKGWKEAALNSKFLRIRLVRDQETNTVKAVAVTPDAKVFFRDCFYEKSEGDDAIVAAIFKEIEDAENDPENVAWRKELQEKQEYQEALRNEALARAAEAIR